MEELQNALLMAAQLQLPVLKLIIHNSMHIVYEALKVPETHTLLPLSCDQKTGDLR